MQNVKSAFLASLLALPACGSVAAPEDPAGPRFVIVGDKGTILASSDGASFVAKTSGTTENLNSVAYGAEKFVAVGDGGVILTSTSGLEFTAQDSPTNIDLAHVIFTGQRFVAVGGDFTLGAVTIASNDGITWEEISSPGTHMFHAVGYKGDTLVAAAYAKSDLQTPALFTLVPGQTWQESVGPDFWDSATNDDGIFTVGGTLFNHFADGIGWTSQTIYPSALPSRAMAYGAGTFVVAGEQGGLYSSADGQTFEDHSFAGVSGWFCGVGFGADSFVAVGAGGLIATSKNGGTWANVSVGTMDMLSDVVYGPGHGTR